MRQRFFIRFIALLIAVMTVFPNTVLAVEEPSKYPGTLSTTTVCIDGEFIEVPVLKLASNARLVRGSIQNSELVCIPNFDEITKADNAKNVSNIKRRAVDTNSFFDDLQYIYFLSTLTYNTSSYSGHRMVDLISFKVEREIYSNAPFDGFRNPTARALQIGPIDGPGAAVLDEIYDQEKDFGTINYNTLYSIPTAWRPVIPGIAGYNVGVEYKVEILPVSGNDYTVTHWHLAD